MGGLVARVALFGPDQADAFQQTLKDSGVAKYDWYPMMRGRLVAINGQTVNPDNFPTERGRRLRPGSSPQPALQPEREPAEVGPFRDVALPFQSKRDEENHRHPRQPTQRGLRNPRERQTAQSARQCAAGAGECGAASAHPEAAPECVLRRAQLHGSCGGR